MISTKIANLADTVLFDAVKGNSMTPERCAKLAAILLDLSHQVAAMEAQPVPLEARLPLRRRPEGSAR